MTSKFTAHGKVPVLLAAAVASAVGADAGAAEWSTGLGTGVFGLNINGEMGFGTNLFGPVELDDVDLSSSDIADVATSAAGLVGYTTNGTWTFLYGGSKLKLEDDTSGFTAAGVPVAVNAKFRAKKATLAVAYTFAHTERSTWSVLGGADYTKHDYDNFLSVGASSATRSIKNDWTDAIVGVMNTFRLWPQWQWANQLDAGFGGSDGTYHARTALNWDVGRPKAWFFTFYADYKHVNFENGSEGQTNWYKYDVSEFGPGIGFGYVFGRTSQGVASEPPPAPPAAYVPPPPAPPPPPLDTDGDSVADTEDKCPNTPQGDKVDPQGCGYNLSLAVLFDDNSATLKSESYAGLNQAFQLMLRAPTMSGVIEGHTDARGTDAHNQVLSERRAKTVVDYLVDHGVDPARVTAKGYGETQPVADNDTPEGQAKNRRVVLHRADAGTDATLR